VSRDALIVFARAPRAGEVKTRLCPPLLPEQAAELYACMLDDVLAESAAACARCGAVLFVTVHPAEATGTIAARAPSSARAIGQRGADLAARMQHAMTEAAAAGFDRIVLRGSDSPTLPGERIEQAYDALRGSDLVLSRDADGGYALLGVRCAHRGLLDHPMSTGSVADDTLENAARLGLRTHELAAGFDLDTAADLQRLRAERSRLGSDLGRRTLAKLDAEGWWPI
jgi:rSAM/selenodomain-associated transferase 1